VKTRVSNSFISKGRGNPSEKIYSLLYITKMEDVYLKEFKNEKIVPYERTSEKE
jgi:hypothetical protein